MSLIDAENRRETPDPDARKRNLRTQRSLACREMGPRFQTREAIEMIDGSPNKRGMSALMAILTRSPRFSPKYGWNTPSSFDPVAPLQPLWTIDGCMPLTLHIVPVEWADRRLRPDGSTEIDARATVIDANEYADSSIRPA